MLCVPPSSTLGTAPVPPAMAAVVGSEFGTGGGAAFSQAHHGLPLAAEGISPTPCCVTWLLRKSSQCPAGIMADMMAWSLDCGWSLARQLHVAYTGFGGDREWVAASEMTARASASLCTQAHVLYE